ncbi:hypothetical protein [Streptomyces sp. NPDC088762]|uniref:hypothetical protein n=1 Tax=Streptomyces sp. NPDC088762 TaxID=3365891 RepID=UPI00382AE099
MNGPVDADDSPNTPVSRLPEGHPSPELLARAGRGLARFLRGYDLARQEAGGGDDHT